MNWRVCVVMSGVVLLCVSIFAMFLYNACIYAEQNVAEIHACPPACAQFRLNFDHQGLRRVAGRPIGLYPTYPFHSDHTHALHSIYAGTWNCEQIHDQDYECISHRPEIEGEIPLIVEFDFDVLPSRFVEVDFNRHG